MFSGQILFEILMNLIWSNWIKMNARRFLVHLHQTSECRLYGRGIRRRFAPMVSGNTECIKMVYNLIFALPGVPVIVYGDEIGMGDNLVYKGRSAVRTPMQWNSSVNGGFSDAPTEKIEIKPVSEGAFSYHFVNVEAEEKDANSILNEIKKFIHVRKELSTMYVQKLKILDIKQEEIVALSYSDKLLIFINFSNKPLKVKTDYNFSEFSVLLEDSSYGLKNEDNTLTLQGYGYRWFKKD